MDIQRLSQGLNRWLEEFPEQIQLVDKQSQIYCIQAIQRLSDSQSLKLKMECELERVHLQWRPLGRLLIVVSEKDILGTTYAMIGAYLTGNRMRIKARYTQPLVQSLKNALALSDHECEILDWQSTGQDDGYILNDIDGIILAGGEALIKHYRRVTPCGVRLIEFGPKFSCALVVGQPDDSSFTEMVDRLVSDTTLFLQQVCSSPQCVIVEQESVAQKLYEALVLRLCKLPRLSQTERLNQYSRATLLSHIGQLDSNLQAHYETLSGWGISLTNQIKPANWFDRGFHLVSGPYQTHLTQLAKLFPHRLQTLGIWGAEKNSIDHGFTRPCKLGEMHHRKPLEPHDGMIELAMLVNYFSP